MAEQRTGKNISRQGTEIGKGFVKTKGFDKSVVCFMSLLKQIWEVSQKHKNFRMELDYDAEALNVEYRFYLPTTSESDCIEQEFSDDELIQATIRLPEKLTQKLQETGMALAKAPCHCDDFFVFPDDDNKRLVIAPTKENSVIDIEVEKAKELVRIIQYQIQEWGVSTMKTISKSYDLQAGGKLRMILELPDDVVKEMDKEKLRGILGNIAQCSHNFYLSAGNELNSKSS